MYLDAWVSMVIFTVATVAFYVLGATVLHRQGLHPEKAQMVATLSEMYVPTLATWTRIVFLIGVWAVLFKTLYVSSASNSRLTADFLTLNGAVRYQVEVDREKWIRRGCVFYPRWLWHYICGGDPKAMVILGGFFQAATLPIIAGPLSICAAIEPTGDWRPSRAFDACLLFAFFTISGVALYAIPYWAVYDLYPVVKERALLRWVRRWRMTSLGIGP